jgi:hypothetical protein
MKAGLISQYERETVSPSWIQIEKILDGLGQTPCALFPDYCGPDSATETFTMPYFDHKPLDSGSVIPNDIFDVPRFGILQKLLGLAPQDDRFILARGNDDAMIPVYYPGDLLVIDSARKATPGKIIVGFHKGEGMVRRLVRENKHLLLEPSNRRYPVERFVRSKWEHYGVLVWVFHNTLSRYVAADSV